MPSKESPVAPNLSASKKAVAPKVSRPSSAESIAPLTDPKLDVPLVDNPIAEQKSDKPTAEEPYWIPPGPRGRFSYRLAILGRRHAPRELQRISQQWGDVVLLKAATQNLFIFNHPELAKEVLVTKGKSFSKTVALAKAKTVLGEGLLTAEGDFHRGQRRMMQPMFMAKRLPAYADMMTECAVKCSHRWEDGAQVEMAAEMERLTLAVVGQTLFSADVEGDAHQIGHALDEAFKLFNACLPPFGVLLEMYPPFKRRFKVAKAALDEVMNNCIQERREMENPPENDLLSVLLNARYDDGTGMSDTQIRHEALTLFLAGHETTANATSWTFMQLAQNPEVEARFHAEIDEVLGDRDATYEDLPRLSYAKRVIQESMRLYPPAWIVGRTATEDIEFNHDGKRFLMPKGSTVLVCRWALHRDERFWEDPLTFNPDRFLPENSEDRPKFAYFPFGGGTRQCIGEGFAYMEATLLVVTLARRWKAKLVEGQNITMLPSITLRPSSGIHMVLERRNTHRD